MRNQEYLITDLPDANDDDKSKNNEKNIEEKISKIMMEYNYLMGTQLEEQRKFFEEKVVFNETLIKELLLASERNTKIENGSPIIRDGKKNR